MANELKEFIVKEMVSRYREASNCLVVGYRGINAIQFDQVRRDLRKKRIFLEVVKNSLAKIALKETRVEGIADLIHGPSVIIIGGDDPVVMVKETIEWTKKIPFVNIRGGFIEGTMLSIDDINSLAKVQSMPVLRAQIVTSINGPVVGVLNTFSAVFRSLATVFRAVKDQKEKSGK